MKAFTSSVIPLALLVPGSGATCLGSSPVVLYDMHDGDMKQLSRMSARSMDFKITPYNNSETWSIQGTFDEACQASIDFNVPGKPSPPPIPLQATLWSLTSAAASGTQIGLEFTDPTGKLSPATKPLNFWFQGYAAGSGVRAELCLATNSGLVVNDMHDSDMKQLQVSSSNQLDIKPYGNNQTWEIHAQFNRNCVANVDFNVPNKPNPPPVALDATIWMASSIAGEDKPVVVFNDPSGSLASKTVPLNSWLPSNPQSY
eukprot:gene8432-1508_t